MEKFRSKYKILVVEDNETLRNGIIASLRKQNYSVDFAEDGEMGFEKFRKNGYHLVISDIKMPKMDGITLFNKIRSEHTDTRYIFITAFATVDIAVESIKNGADDFITKPFSVAELRNKVDNIFQNWVVINDSISNESDISGLIGNSISIKKIKNIINKVSKVDSPVLITGESGTGKEVVAKSIHDLSNHSDGPFISVNCGALNANLLESELFGHEKGSFTGAIKSHAGKFEQACGGTLLLDEIGEMDVNLQVKLLRVLQERKFQRVGGEKYISPKFRLLAATNRELKKEVEKGNFRSDLFYRLNVIPIIIPPIRKRKDDISLLTEYIIKKKSKEIGRKIPKITSSVMAKIKSYSWPGNVRELENFLERSLIFIDEDIFTDSLFEMSGIEENDMAMQSSNLVETLEKMEREMIVNALKDCNGIKQQASKQLNIKTSTLYYKMEKFNIINEEYI